MFINQKGEPFKLGWQLLKIRSFNPVPRVKSNIQMAVNTYSFRLCFYCSFLWEISFSQIVFLLLRFMRDLIYDINAPNIFNNNWLWRKWRRKLYFTRFPSQTLFPLTNSSNRYHFPRFETFSHRILLVRVFFIFITWTFDNVRYTKRETLFPVCLSNCLMGKGQYLFKWVAILE